MKVVFVPEGPPTWASSRLRVWWLCEAWGPDAGVMMVPYEGEIEFSLEGVDALVIQHKILRETTKKVIEEARRLKMKVIGDMCDPVWWWARDAVELVEACDLIVTSTDALAAALRRELSKPAFCIPDRQRLDVFAVKEHKEVERPVLMWHGVYINRGALWNVSAELQRLYAAMLKFEVRIVDNMPDIEASFLSQTVSPPMQITYQLWRLEDFYSRTLVEADIGLVPPLPGAWGYYKSSNKEDAFHIAGIPTNDGSDIIQLARLIEDWELRNEMGKRLRQRAVRTCGIEESVEDWKRLLQAML